MPAITPTENSADNTADLLIAAEADAAEIETNKQDQNIGHTTDEQLAALMEAPAAGTTTQKKVPAPDAAAVVTDAAPAKEEPTSTTQVGTDKAVAADPLAKIQTDLAAANTRIEQLTAKLDAGEKLTTAEKKEAQQAVRKIDSIRDAIAANKFDALESGDVVAQSLLETDSNVQGLTKTVKDLSEVVTALRATQTWEKVQTKYPGVDVEMIWEKCVKEAGGIVGENNPALDRLANKYFHERADIAAKSVKAKKAANLPAPTATRETTKGAAEVNVSNNPQTGAPVDEDAAYTQLALNLVAKD